MRTFVPYTMAAIALCATVELLTPAGSCHAFPGSSGRARSSNRKSTADIREIKKVFARGTVVETMDAKRYTYVRINTGGPEVWAAGPRTEVEIGDTVAVPHGTEMTDFYSPSFERKFDLIYFVWRIQVEDRKAETKLPTGHPVVSSNTQAQATIAVPEVKRAPGKSGKTVAEIRSQIRELAGQKISVRGTVVKYNPDILSRNWVGIRDGSAEGDAGLLTITTDDVTRRGDVVLARGILATNQNFGLGYKYDVLLSESSLKVEKRVDLEK